MNDEVRAALQHGKPVGAPDGTTTANGRHDWLDMIRLHPMTDRINDRTVTIQQLVMIARFRIHTNGRRIMPIFENRRSLQ